MRRRAFRLTTVGTLAAAVGTVGLAKAGEVPVPSGARVTLSCDREEYVLGENVLVHLKLGNGGDAPFDIETGGDYRSSARAQRFKVSATDENGKALVDPYPNGPCFGGICVLAAVTRDKPFWVSVPVARYLLFERPGTYTLRIRHDFGWTETSGRPYPEGSLVLRLKRPSKEQARALVKAWLDEKPVSNDEAGRKDEPYADFDVIRAAEYLEPLVEAVEAGRLEALPGVGSIETPEATRTLVRWLSADEGKIRRDASRLLEDRLPEPHLREPDAQEASEDGLTRRRRRLVERAWRAEFTADVLAAAARFLESTDDQWVARGAYYAWCVGGVSETRRIVEALSREIPKAREIALSTRTYPSQLQAFSRLRQVAHRMVRLGAEIPLQPVSPGEAVMFLTALQARPTFRPAGWIETCDRLLQSEFPLIQECVLAALPAPLPEPLRGRLRPILAGGDVGAAIKACEVVERDLLAEMKEPILGIMRATGDHWLFGAASRAALAVGARYERMRILASRMDEPGMLMPCLQGLMAVIENGSDSWGTLEDKDARRIKPLWEAFILKHEGELKAGKTFAIPSEEITPDLFPEGFKIRLKDGKMWPGSGGKGQE